MDVITQYFPRRKADYDLYDAYAFGVIHSGALSGSILSATIELKSEPCRDTETEENNRILQRLPPPFHALFEGGPGGPSDGWLSWDTAVRFGNVLSDGSTKKQMIPPTRLPLEVGYTEAGTTYGHLSTERGLARWPYGSTEVTLLKVIDPDFMRHLLEL
jgi:hypothetical protein